MTWMQIISTGLAATIDLYYLQTLWRRREFRALGLGHILLMAAFTLWAVASWVGVR